MHSVRERPSRLVCISSLLSVEITPTKFSLNARGFLQTKRQQIATRSVYDAVGIQLPPFQAEGDGHKSLGKEPSENVVRSLPLSHLPRAIGLDHVFVSLVR